MMKKKGYAKTDWSGHMSRVERGAPIWHEGLEGW